MNARGHYGIGIGQEPSKSKDSSWKKWLVPGAIGGVILLGVVLERKIGPWWAR